MKYRLLGTGSGRQSAEQAGKSLEFCGVPLVESTEQYVPPPRVERAVAKVSIKEVTLLFVAQTEPQMSNIVLVHINFFSFLLWAFLVKSIASYEGLFSTLAGRFQPSLTLEYHHAIRSLR